MNQVSLHAGLAGEYRMVVQHADGTAKDTGWFHNLILDSGLNHIGSGFQDALLAYARVGTGTSTPVVTQAQLDSQLAVSTSSSSSATAVTNDGSPLYRSTLTFTYVFNQGAVVGNITEVGIGWATTGATLFSRALMLDNAGSPTTVTLVALDQLTVYYRLRITPPLTDGVGSVTLGATTYNYTSRILQASNFGAIQYMFLYGFQYFGQVYATVTQTYGAGAGLAPITATAPTGSQTGAVPTTDAKANAYTLGTFYRDTPVTWPIGSGNATGGIQALALTVGYPYQQFRFQIVFATPIPKTNTNVLILNFRFSWGRG